jgi:2-polyprenyl-3-methyl-5-hydroxy-6-metoxy-1,4-benzoquinol methylase
VTEKSEGARTSRGQWDDVWSTPPRARLPSSLSVGIGDLKRLLRAHVTPGMRVLEVGCAPGKTLAWMGRELGAEVAGLDYSPRGVAVSRDLLRALGVDCDLRCEDIFATTFEPASFDVVFSAGVIEHFEDPRDIVRRHVRLVRPGGKALCTVPHYGGLYGRLQRYLDPENLALHNLSIMRVDALERLAPADLVEGARAYPAGRLSPWLLSFERRWPRPVARAVCHVLNGVGLVQPVQVRALCPTLVLECTRRDAGDGPGC